MTVERDVARCLADARAGTQDALGQALEACRAYLLLIAQQELAPDVRAKGGASDLVQETFLEAQRDFARFQGETEQELLAWLRQLLLHNLANFTRSFRDTAKREVGREAPLSGPSPPQLEAASPTAEDQAIAHEEEAAVRQALQRLSEDHRTVLTLRHEEGLSFEEIGTRMERSANAVRKLFARAVERLQEEMGPPNDVA